jgi:uncharacterized protein (DUF849 family)
MRTKVVISCAVTGAGATLRKHPGVPVTPAQIADAALTAAQAGAAVAHIHVRDPKTGDPSRDIDLFRETVDRIRQKNDQLIINLTTGVGSDVYFGTDQALQLESNTDLVGPVERFAHIEAIRPDICSLDCGTFNFDNANAVMINTPAHIRLMATSALGAGVKPELEVFELGHVEAAKRLIALDVIEAPPLLQICLGVFGGAPATTKSMTAFVDSLPVGAVWSAFGVGPMQFPMAVQSVLLGGHVRVGLEDNLYLSKGRLATNAELVAHVATLVTGLGASVASPIEARSLLGLV